MTLHMTRTDAKAEIRDLLEDWAAAARAGDLEGVMAAYAPDVLAFDAIAQLQFKGVEAYRKHWQMCVEMCSGPMTFEIHDLGIEADGGVAFAHYLLRCGGTGPDGKEQTGWMRVTVGCRRTDGRWQIAHEHFSVPFDMASGKALLGLEPSQGQRPRHRGAIGDAIRALAIAAGAGVAFCHGAKRASATPDGLAAARHVPAGDYLLAHGRRCVAGHPRQGAGRG